MKKRYIPLLITLLFLSTITGISFGQDFGQRRVQTPRKEREAKQKFVTVESVVKDADGKPLQNVLVSGKEGAIEVMTDDIGHFAIKVPDGTDLLFESEGLESQAISLTNGIPPVVTMKKAAFLMEERNVVNIAFGTVKKKVLIGAVSTADPKRLKKFDDTESFYDALTGKIPGLIGSSNIRGLGTALIVVDGVPRDPSTLNLSEIEQISVLKDGNAAMLWGSRAQNGVILVTTRRGTAFKRKIEVSYERGISQPIAIPKYLNTPDYYKYFNEALANDGLAAKYSDSLITHYADGRNPYRYPSQDYYSSEFLKSSKPFQRILTEMSGGNATTRYYANIGWNRAGTLYDQGESAKMSSNRFNMRGNVDFQVNEYIKASVDGVFIFNMNKQPNGNFWGDASTIHPDYFSALYPIADIATTPWAGITTSQRTALNNLPGQIQTAKKINNDFLLGGTTQYASNPYGMMYRSGATTNNTRTATINTSIEVDLKNVMQGLKFKTFMTFDIYNQYLVTTNPTYAVYNPTYMRFGAGDSIVGLAMTGTDVNNGVQSVPTNSTYVNGKGPNGTPYFERSISVNAMLDYERTFNDVHHVTGTLLAYYAKFRVNQVMNDRKDAHLGFRMTYDYKQKYLVDFSSTYTNGQHLPPGKMGGFAPSVGLGWNLSEENCLKDSRTINFLKVRASASIQNIDPDFGQTGEYRPYMESFQNGSYYSYADGISTTRTVTIMRSSNYNMTFAKMKSINAGAEGYFFDRLLYLDANVFTNRWEGQVVMRYPEYPSWVGNNAAFTNSNVTGYTGAELGATLSKSAGKFYFELSGNLLFAKSNRVKYTESPNPDYMLRQGKPTDAMFGLQSLGLFQNATDIFDSPTQKYSAPKPGDIKYKDENRDGVIDGTDAVVIGNSTPRYNYGLNLVLKYGAFSFMATGDGAADFQRMLTGAYFQVNGNGKYSVEILNRWAYNPALGIDTRATATYPRLSSVANSNNTQYSTYWMINGDYFRLNRVQLTFEVPKKLIPGWPTKEISIYARCSNVKVWETKAFQQELNIGGEPDYRSYALGINVLF